MVVDAPRIAAAVAALFDHEVALLQELVRLPSVPNDPAERLAVRRMADVLRCAHPRVHNGGNGWGQVLLERLTI